MGKLADKVAKGVFWTLMEKSGIQLAHFAVTLVLARLLTPDDYGTVALLSIFISLSNLFVDCGFGKALVQKKNVTQTDCNSVFYLSMAIAASLYAVLFFAAPSVSRFYNVPELAPMLRLLALSLIFHSINGVQNVELNRKMLFRLSFRVSWVQVAFSSATGIACAAAGCGAWALVWASLAGGVAGVVARQLVIRWRPTLSFSWNSIGGLFRFGWKMTAAGLLTRGYNELYGLLIGKFYARADLAFVRKGAHVPKVARSLVEGALSRVSFTALAKLQDDPERLRRAMRKMIRCSVFMAMPAMAILAAVAEPLVRVLFGAKWLPAVPYLRIACIGGAIAPFTAINNQALLARGRSDVLFKIMLIYRAAGLGLMAATISHGVLAFFLCNTLFSALFGIVVWASPNRRFIGYTAARQAMDVAPSAVMGLAAGSVSLAVLSASSPAGACSAGLQACMAVSAAAAGAAVYACLALTVRSRPFGELAKAVLPAAAEKAPRVARLLAFVATRCREKEAEG